MKGEQLESVKFTVDYLEEVHADLRKRLNNLVQYFQERVDEGKEVDDILLTIEHMSTKMKHFKNTIAYLKERVDEKEKRMEGWDSPTILKNFKEICDKNGGPDLIVKFLLANEVVETTIQMLLEQSGYENGEEIIKKIKEDVQ